MFTKQPVLSITISSDDENCDDQLKIKALGTPNQVLGMVTRMRHELNEIEKQVIASLAAPKVRDTH